MAVLVVCLKESNISDEPFHSPTVITLKKIRELILSSRQLESSRSEGREAPAAKFRAAPSISDRQCPSQKLFHRAITEARHTITPAACTDHAESVWPACEKWSFFEKLESFFKTRFYCAFVQKFSWATDSHERVFKSFAFFLIPLLLTVGRSFKTDI